MSRILKAVTANGEARVYLAETKELVDEVIKRHNMSPVAGVAIGRLLTAGAMMGTMMKNEQDILTIRIKGNGPIGDMLVTAKPNGDVKGYVTNPQVFVPLKEDGKIDVAKAVGIGVLSVTKDMGLKEPYIGDCILVTSEIGDDLTYYFATSEQTPSAVGLGTTLNSDNTVKASAGFIIQMMPDATDETIGTIEVNIANITSVSGLIEEGKSLEDILAMILKGLEYKIVEEIPARFKCDCSRKKVTDALLSLGSEELKSLIDEGKPVETTCQFCGERYEFGLDELSVMEQAMRVKEQLRRSKSAAAEEDGNEKSDKKEEN
ncbi:Hsp33 family molecular chaperone HslO [Howardella ureilytica]